MRLLLDTHVWLWSALEPKRLGKKTISAIESRENQLFLSIASVWEIAIKSEAGKIRLPEEFEPYVRSRIVQSEVTLVPVALDHVLALKNLERLHRDPFDRIMATQAKVEKMTLVTADERLLSYDVTTLDARK